LSFSATAGTSNCNSPAAKSSGYESAVVELDLSFFRATTSKNRYKIIPPWN